MWFIFSNITRHTHKHCTQYLKRCTSNSYISTSYLKLCSSYSKNKFLVMPQTLLVPFFNISSSYFKHFSSQPLAYPLHTSNIAPYIIKHSHYIFLSISKPDSQTSRRIHIHIYQSFRRVCWCLYGRPVDTMLWEPKASEFTSFNNCPYSFSPWQGR